ncbi:ankyrin repeat-containing domain protein [Ilyonectria sp. MPI-CAGE-AT-0026]|nr:ankyrin repeat-containing domain protein [Ilyonectria sp. MPI-CAGE-AT-0026]
MSFGFGVGDIIKAVELCHKLRRDFADAPRQWREINEEMRSLSIVLGDVDICVSTGHISDKDANDLLETACQCRNILDELAEIANANRVLGKSNVNASDNAKRVWKRLKWDPDDIRDIRGRISSNVGLLNAFHHRIARNNTARLIQHVEDRELRTVLAWFCPVDYGVQQSDLIVRRQPHTGEWLLNSQEFQQWLETPGATLFCPGIPGAGKTMMTAVAVDHLLLRPEFAEGVGIAYIYFNFRRAEEQTFTHLIASLATADELLNVLHAIATLPSFSRLFVIVDALDECQSSGNLRAKILSVLFHLQQREKLNIFATSRFIYEIQNIFTKAGAITVEIRASTEDIQAYLDSILSTLPKCVRKSPQLQEEIKNTILEAVDGMFLLAKIYASSLEDKLTPKAVRATLGYFREQGIRSSTDEDEKLQALKPLKTVELTHALTIDETRLLLEEDNIPELEDIISVCHGLVTVDEKSNIVRLVHYTTQEYFEHKREYWFPDAEWTIACACLATLTVGKWPLASLQLYAAEHWGHHLSRAPMRAQRRRQVIDFLRRDNLSPALAPCMGFDSSERREIASNLKMASRCQIRLKGLHLAAYFADETDDSALNVPDCKERTPLFYAIRSGHEDAVSLLIRRGANVKIRTQGGLTPLTVAVKHNYEKIAQILIDDGAKIDQTSAGWSLFGLKQSTTALCIAAGHGHVGMVKLLLTHGAGIDFKNKNGEMAIFIAATVGQVKVMQMLIEKGADIESADRSMTTPLMQACYHQHLEAVKILLREGANLEKIDNYGKTAMSIVASSGSETILIALMEAGARIDHGDFLDQTPLLLAATQGHASLVEILLSKGANVEAYRKFVYRKVFFREPRISDLTPLQAAASYGRASVVATLLRHSADIEARDAEGRTSLMIAAWQKKYDVVKFLIDLGADIYARDRMGRNALYPIWIRRDNKEIARLLHDKGVRLRGRRERKALENWLTADSASTK